jgi:hypothetical protein
MAFINFSFLKTYKVHIASISFALLIWVLVVSDNTFDYTVSIPIRTSSGPSQLVVVPSLPATAKVRIRGQGYALLAFSLFREAQLEPKIEWTVGPQTIRFNKEDVMFSGSAREISVLHLLEPLEFSTAIERLAKKEVWIKNRTQLKPMAGYTVVGDVVVEPARASLIGPGSYIHKVDTVYTEEKKLEKLKRPLQSQVAIQIGPAEYVTVNPDRVLISAEIQKLMEKRITGVPLHVINTPPGYTAIVIPPTLSLMAEGGVGVVANVTANHIKAYIDYTRDQNQTGLDYPAYVDPIASIRFRAIEPKRFKVILERGK